MPAIILFSAFTIVCWTIFLLSFRKDRSRYRNCYFLFVALLSPIPLIATLTGDYFVEIAFFLFFTTFLGLLAVPFFLIYNGIVLIRREGGGLAHLLSLGLGIVVFLGEAASFAIAITYVVEEMQGSSAAYFHSALFTIEAVLAVSVIYRSMSFLLFLIYTVFLQVIPKKKDFDYVIILGAGLQDGQDISKLLMDRLEKAIDLYRKDPTPPKMIPSGGQGSDELISEAEAMKRYLLFRGIPESDILMEDRSTTTMENLSFSKEIIDSGEGNKFTAIVTSNYHVYRALRYGRKIGLYCNGIGSHVAFYYWPSAVIREFIALHTEKKHAIMFFLGWLLCIGLLLLLIYG